jgi:hypothetical protein
VGSKQSASLRSPPSIRQRIQHSPNTAGNMPRPPLEEDGYMIDQSLDDAIVGFVSHPLLVCKELNQSSFA